MTQKTISLPQELYLKLLALKKPSETFPDLIKRLIQIDETIRKRNLMDFAGIIDDEDDEWERIEKEIYNDRNRISSRKEYSLDEIEDQER